MVEAKAEDALLDNWVTMVSLLGVLQEKWNAHIENVHKMNIDYVHPQLQKHMAHGFNRAEFYLALPDLVEYGRSLGGIECLQIRKEKKEDGRRTEGPKSYTRK